MPPNKLNAVDFTAVVAAASPSRGIGLHGRLPWRIPADMARFKALTSTSSPGIVNAVVMGRKTWESIPPKFRPLRDRTNVVLSRRHHRLSLPSEVLAASSLEDASDLLSRLPNLGIAFLIGGAELYDDAIRMGVVSKVHYTEVSGCPPGMQFDAFFPPLPEEEWECALPVTKDDEEADGDGGGCENWHVCEVSGLTYRFLEYHRRRTPR